MSSNLTKRIEKIANDAIAANDKKKSQLDLLDISEGRAANGGGRQEITRKTTPASVLRDIAENGGIQQFDLFPGQEYPTTFTRIPLFPPIQRKTARHEQHLKTKETDFVCLKSRWDSGGVWRAGPALTVYDEDTLAGLMQLRTYGFTGDNNQMPSKVLGERKKKVASHPSKPVTVHAAYCTVSKLEEVIKGKRAPTNGWGGAIIGKRRESIERLAAVALKFENPRNQNQYRGKTFHILEIDWIGDENDTTYYVQFHPAIVSWLDGYRTFIDLGIRRKLTPFGKAVHRFLSSQRSNKVFDIEFSVLCEAIGYNGYLPEAKRSAKGQLEKLKKLGFLSAFEISGSGRSEPYWLIVYF